MVRKERFNLYIIIMIAIVAALLIFNQWQISSISNMLSGGIKKLDVSEIYKIKSTAQSVASLFPVEDIQTADDAVAMMIAQGTPDYGEAMGISFDDPVGALNILSNAYNGVKADIKQNNPDVWERYLNLATKPVGISCEFCCGVGAVGITNSGELRCGCQHNPAIQTLTMLLMKDTSMNDAEVLREAMKWKAVWFPKDMINLALKAAGGEVDAGVLPGMVGGC